MGEEEGGLPLAPEPLPASLARPLISILGHHACTAGCQALEHLGKLTTGLMMGSATLEPQNQSFQETLRRLNTKHPGEGELDPEGGPSYKPRPPLPIPRDLQLGQQDTRAGLTCPLDGGSQTEQAGLVPPGFRRSETP